MNRSFTKEKIKQIMQETRQRILNALVDLKNKERSLRERSQEFVRERKGGADPATS